MDRQAIARELIRVAKTLIAGKQVSKDRFTAKNKPIKYYLDALTKLGCPKSLIDQARDATAGRKIKQVDKNEDSASTLIWDGNSLTIYNKWDDEFERLHIIIASGYIDFGHSV